MRKALAVVAFSFISPFVQRVPQTLPEYGGMPGQQRQGSFAEFILTPSNVSAATFGKISTVALDGGQIYSQPLFVQGVTIGTGTFDLIVVASMANTIWAIDAHALAMKWKTNLGSGYGTYPNHSNVSNNYYQNTVVGCVSTPAVDVAQGWLFAVCPDATGAQNLYKLNLTSGAVISSTAITGQFPGTGTAGDTIIAGQLQFLPGQHEQRPGLAISHGNVYITFASYNDQEPWHGWVFAYTESTLSQVAVWCSTPNGSGGGIWLTGDAPPVDSAGNIYFSTGNGDYDGNTNFGDSVIKLSPTLTLVDWFTASNYAMLQADDLDVTSGPVMLPGDGFLLAADKDYREYVLSTTCMGHLEGSVSSCTPQLVTFPGSGLEGTFGGLYWNHTIYIPVDGGPILAYAYTAGSMAASPFAQTSASYAEPGARLAISSNGNQNGVLWATTCASSAHLSPQAGVLRAFNPTTMAELYNSTINGGDTLGTFAKFNVPMVVDGRVFVATGDGTLAVYGLK